MQGSIFTAFSELVIEQQGIAAWDAMLDQVQPASEGIYTRGQQYDDDELFSLVAVLSERTGLPATDLVRAFGQFLFNKLYANLPAKVATIDNLRDFLLAVDSVIHVEVKRVHPSAYLPSFSYDETADGSLIMYYQSKRKLCHAAEGLILGAAAQFDTPINILHPECMHDGCERCKLIVQFKE